MKYIVKDRDNVCDRIYRKWIEEVVVRIANDTTICIHVVIQTKEPCGWWSKRWNWIWKVFQRVGSEIAYRSLASCNTTDAGVSREKAESKFIFRGFKLLDLVDRQVRTSTYWTRTYILACKRLWNMVHFVFLLFSMLNV